MNMEAPSEAVGPEHVVTKDFDDVSLKEEIAQAPGTPPTSHESPPSSQDDNHEKKGSDSDTSSRVQGEDTGNDSDGDSESDSSDDDDDDDDDDHDQDDDDTGGNLKEGITEEGMSEYERLRLLRIQKNNERLRQLGLFKEEKTTKSHKKGSVKKKTAPKKRFEPARQQPKREVKGKISDELLWLSGLTSKRPLFSKNGKNNNNKKKTRCGQCAGCTRQDDCQTCVYCVDRNSGNATKTRRCIFKVCRNYNNGDDDDNNNAHHKKALAQSIKKSPKQQQTNGSEQVQRCDVCKNGNDLIVCPTCRRGFHSNCHVPKIKKLPSDDDVWLCMECNPRSIPNGCSVALLPGSTKLITVKIMEPAPECTVCEDPCTESSQSVHCKACDKHLHLACCDPVLETKPKGGAARIWRCTTCKASDAPLLEKYQKAAAAAANKTPKLKNLVLFEGEHEDDCYICFNGGELVCCDFCPKVFHCACHIPALPAIPTGIWKCCECYASERNRMTRCGDCKACRAKDCGKCKFCLDRPKFGGPNKLKKSCVRRECPYQSFAETFVEGKIPGEITHGPVNKAKNKSQSKKRRRDSDTSNLQGKKKRAKKA